MPAYAQRIATSGTTIFTKINVLAQQHYDLHPDQGKSDFDMLPDTDPDTFGQLVWAAQLDIGSAKPVYSRFRDSIVA